jgi:hypothetical protein
MLTVDSGTDHGSLRFYVLVVGAREGQAAGPAPETVCGEILVPESDELRITHRHEIVDEAA